MGHFDDRALTSVDVYGLQYLPGEDAGVTAHVSFTVANFDGGEMGPTLQMQLFIPAGIDEPLGSVQERLIKRAHDLVRRLANENGDALIEVLGRSQQFDFRKL